MGKNRELGDTAVRVFQKGTSMRPTLRDGCLLDVVPYAGRDVRVGDVVVFTPPDFESRMVHRVVSTHVEGVRTRGDNCREADEWVIPYANIQGRVVSAQWGMGRSLVHSGFQGRCRVLGARVFRPFKALIQRILRPLYHRLTQVGVLTRWVSIHGKTRVVSYRRPYGVELHLVWGRFVIGRYLSWLDSWQIQPPFRLVLRESALPRSDGGKV